MYKYIHIAVCSYSQGDILFYKNKLYEIFDKSGVEYRKPENAQNEFTQQCMQRPKNCVCMVSEY